MTTASTQNYTGPKGRIFNLQSFSTNDGPGIRTVVFFQGCNLSCTWCHNPESQPMDTPVAFLPEKCIGCRACDKAEYTCYAGARAKTSRDFEPEELWKLLSTDVPYLKNSKGGITFSGGECMLQTEFLKTMIDICRKHNIHTAVDTAGHVPYDWLTRVSPDLFLYDIKASSPKRHKELTGVDGVLIWENLEKLIHDKHPVQIRIPCVPGANWEELPEIAVRLEEIGGHNGLPVELLPYHRLGEGKATWFGKEPQIFKTPSEEEMREIWKMFDFQKKSLQG